MSGSLINSFKRDDIEIYVSFVILMVKPPVLKGSRSVVHKSAKGLVRLLGVGLLLSKRGSRAAQETCKTHSDA